MHLRRSAATFALTVALLTTGVGLSSAGTAAAKSKPPATAAPDILAAPVQVVATSDGTVSYRSIGSGSPAILLIMGYSGSMDEWQPAFVDRLARTHRVVIFDSAGIGKTTLPPGTLTMDVMANQTAAFISALHLDRPAVLGWSMGGMIAQALAVLHPGDVGRLVLAATYPGNGKATLPTSTAVGALENPSAANAGALLKLLFPPDHAADASAYLKAITAFPNFYLAPAAVDSLQLKALADWTEGADPAGPGIAKLKMPVLVADGSVDALVPVGNDRELAKAIPDAQLVLYPDASHGFLFQDETAFLARVLHFVG
jgi:pimeloyl-ACP methyl ester carboxylesterase